MLLMTDKEAKQGKQHQSRESPTNTASYNQS